MGQKVHPTGIRLGISKKWSSNWFSDSSSFSKNVHQDFLIRELLNKKLKDAAVSNIQIERSSDNVTVTIFSARPGIVIGKKGEGIEGLRKEVKDCHDREKRLENEKKNLEGRLVDKHSKPPRETHNESMAYSQAQEVM